MTKKRSIHAPPLMLPTYNARQRPSPPVNKTAEAFAGEETQVAWHKNLV